MVSHSLFEIPIQKITLEALGKIAFGTWVLIVFGYIVLMGCLFKVLNGGVRYVLRWLVIRFTDDFKRNHNVVSYFEILKEAHLSKDYEALKISELRKKESLEVRQENRELAYLSVAVLSLAVASHLLLPGNAIGAFIQQLLPWFSEDGAILIELVVLVPMLVIIGESATDDGYRDGDIYHPALRAEIDRKRPKVHG
jgi:hypothetical protein